MQFEIVIPTRNGGRWLGQLLIAYRRLGAEPLYIVDARTNDGTQDLLRKMEARFVEHLPAGDCVEAGMIEAGSRHTEKDWIFRIDDDEFPSAELLRWAEDIGCKTDTDGWRISRLTLLKDGRGIKYSRIATHFLSPVPNLCDPQLRFYRHRHVDYSNVLHSPGVVTKRPIQYAPANAYFVHLDVLLRSAGERLAKLRRYEEMEPNSSWKFAYQYVPDAFPHVDQRPAPLPTREFDELLASLPPAIERPYSLSEDERARIKASAGYYTIRAMRRDRYEKSPLARKTIAEFLCTVGRAIARVEDRLPARPGLGEFICDYGTDLYDAAERRAWATSRFVLETKTMSLKAQSPIEKWSQ